MLCYEGEFMYKRPLLITAASALSAVCIILYHFYILIAVPFCLIPVIFYRRKSSSAFGLAIVVFTVFAAGLFQAAADTKAYENASARILSSELVTLSGSISRKEKTDYGTRVTVRLRGQRKLKVTALVDYELPLGTKIRIVGNPQLPAVQRNPGCFDESSYLKSLSIITQLKDAEITPTGEKLFFLSKVYYQVLESFYRLKYRMQDVFTAVLPGEEGSLLSALCIGTKSLLSPEVKEIFANAGISHILAVSGLHISIIGAMIYKLLKKLKRTVRTSAVVSFIFLFFYSVTISDSVSCRRALLMYAVIMISDIIGDGCDIITSLSLVCIILCLTDPLAVSQTAFTLSFASVFMLSLTAVKATECYHSYCVLRWENRHKEIKGNRFKPTAVNDLITSLLFSFFIQIGMAPISSSYFYCIPLLSCILNVLILPLLPFVLFLGLIGGLVGIIFLPLTEILLFPAHLILYWYEFSSSAYAAFPFTNIVTGDVSWLKVILCLSSAYAMSVIFDREIQRMFERRFRRIPWKKNQVFPFFGSRNSSFAIAALSASIIIILAITPHHDETAVLDVGQGDGILITTADGNAFMIDGGSSSDSSIAKNVLLPSLKYRGLSSVDGWFITHLDDDHVGGLLQLLDRHYPINTVYLSKYIPSDEKLSLLKNKCELNGTQISYLDSGNSLSCSYFRVETIFPDKRSDFTGTNENSLVTLFTINPASDQAIKLIETGDIGEEQERYILGRYKQKLKKSSANETLILKSAHHGSNYSNCSEWLSALGPDLVIISAGKNNRYGHPGKDTMKRIKELNLEPLCTIDTGQIKIQNGKVRSFISQR